MAAKGIASRLAASPPARKTRAVVDRIRLQRHAGRGRLPAREDPIPTTQTFPSAKYVIVVGGIPRHYAGRTASILTKTRLWHTFEGVETTVVTMFSSGELDDLSHIFGAKGALAPGVRLASLHDYYPDDSIYDGPPIHHPVDEPGMRWIKEKDQPVYRYFDEHGVYRIYKRFDYRERLIVRDFFNENRSRTRRDEFRSNGTLKRTVYWDLQHNEPRQDIHYARNGTPLFNHWTSVSADGTSVETQRVTFFDSAGAPVRVGSSYEPVLHACLDNLIGGERAFVTGESRVADEMLLNYRRPNVKRLFVLHNAHISEPYDDIHRIRASYRTLLTRADDADAVVFLTRTQRAEAEAHFGPHPQFKVIPHSAQKPPLDPSLTRNLKRVVMMARLDQQKQVDQAIDAFERVVQAVPGATLEIYGRGQLQSVLAARIRSLKLQDSVKLMGYTTDVHRVYQEAGLCMMTSRYEGAPLTVVESLMHGCPVVSYDLRYGPADIITDEVNGFLVPYGDVRGMADRIVSILKHPDLHRALIEQAGLDTDGFTEETFVRRWSGLFHELSAKGWDAPAHTGRRR